MFGVIFGVVLGKAGGRWVFFLVELIFIGLIVLMWRWRPKIAYENLSQAIKKYLRANPAPNLVDGTRFAGELPRDKIKEELFNYAPERILIAPTNDMVDMLVLNRFHFENKTCVVSAAKYPKHVFDACQRFLAKVPDLPVEMIHDVSRPGLSLKDQLLAYPSWNLKDKNVKDLGLFPDDVKKIKEPIWIPTGTPARTLGPKSSAADPVQAQIDQGMAMPLDFAGPKVMMGALAVAVVAGLLLMSEELLAEQVSRGLLDSGSSGGFG